MRPLYATRIEDLGSGDFRNEERADRPMPRPESGAAACRAGAGALYHGYRLQAQGDSRAAGRAGDARRRAAQCQ
jgi:hypothetical protein